MAEEAFDWNMALSFGGPLTFRNAKELRALLVQLPLQRLMLETDAPYLTPHPHRGKRNEPAYVPLIAQGLAEIKTTSVAEIASATSALAQAVFAKLALDGHN
jgi:TatD DNase family protein